VPIYTYLPKEMNLKKKTDLIDTLHNTEYNKGTLGTVTAQFDVGGERKKVKSFVEVHVYIDTSQA
jgi:hypothetical protein